MNEPPINLDALARGDPAVISEVHARYYPELYRYARYRVTDPDIAEDIVGDVFIRLLEAVGLRKGPRQNLRGWLLGTCSHVVSDHFRRVYRQTSQGLGEDLAGSEPGPPMLFEEGERRDALRTAMVTLTEEQQHVIALRFGAGYSLRETAELVGKGVNAVKALQFRAVAALRRALGDVEL
jgi:RNA polymerase sigma-70 factor (ECF subfamily)